jgi:hypothetical protein
MYGLLAGVVSAAFGAAYDHKTSKIRRAVTIGVCGSMGAALVVGRDSCRHNASFVNMLHDGALDSAHSVRSHRGPVPVPTVRDIGSAGCFQEEV